MLTIRAEQMAVLDDVPLVPWLIRMLRALFPDSAGEIGDAALGAMVRRSVARGRSMGFGRDELGAWVALEHVFGESFPEQARHAWAHRLLEQHRTNPSQALQALREQAILRLSGIIMDETSDKEAAHG